MRTFVTFEVSSSAVFKKNLLAWCARFQTCCVLDSNQWNSTSNELIAAAGSVDEISPRTNSFEALKKMQEEKKDWLFGYLSYDLKNETETLTSNNFDGLGFPQMHFFQPEYVFILQGNSLKIGLFSKDAVAEKAEKIFQEIAQIMTSADVVAASVSLKSRVSETEYIEAINRIKQHIRSGDIYELNYCMEFFSESATIAPVEVFQKLSEVSRAPFSAFYRKNMNYLMCASPERFLKKAGNKIISQPIKGTAKRGANSKEDLEMIARLKGNEKEKSENVMIVDLVRNDLSKTCDEVKVEELFGVYTFNQWHQMMSTVSGVLREGVDLTELIKGCFPMGSMTGAPKVEAMKLIEKYETTKRGLYSGAVGYITPEGDFDFNVVIRSILYNANTNYLSLQVGSAITANAEPEQEYAECLLKAQGMFEALNISLNHRYLRT